MSDANPETTHGLDSLYRSADSAHYLAECECGVRTKWAHTSAVAVEMWRLHAAATDDERAAADVERAIAAARREPAR